MGSDTGGSIRLPAAFSGCVGLKATYGRVSRRGVVPLSFGLDHTGPLTRTVEDCALAMQALAGFDPADVIAETEYGGPVVAMVARGNCAGTQFHVEKSQFVGLRILSNFLTWTP
jgi:aspartyl-tRNA(Asn)/glutamyl-tRNA(Gln) amidotransferase subunit A